MSRRGTTAEEPTRAVRFLVPVAGLDFSARAGEVVQLPESVAAPWIDGVRGQDAADPWPPKTARPEALVADVAAVGAQADSVDPGATSGDPATAPTE